MTMVRTLLLSAIMLLSGSALCSSQSPAARETYNINRNWKFFPEGEVSSDNAQRVNLPHVWNTDALSGRKDYYRGSGNYLKDIDIHGQWRGRRVFIRFYGVNTQSYVMVNGKHIGTHRSGYNAFTYEITDHLRFGRRNFLWVVVSNASQLDILPVAGDQNSYGGIFRDVELIVTGGGEVVSLTDHGSDGVYIAQKEVTAEKVEGEAVVMVSGTKDATVTAELAIFTPQSDTVARRSVRVKLNGKATATAKIPFLVNNPRLWNGTSDPFMYNVGVRIVSGSKVSDELTIKTGFRSVAITAEGFMLNGQKYPVRGVVVTQDRASSGPALTHYQVREDFDLITSMGANAVRVKGVAHNPEFYRLCDSRGILVWSDFPLMGPAYLTDKAFIDTEAFRSNGLMQVDEMIRQQYNHPSVVMWGLFSNMMFRGDDPTDYIRSIDMKVKRDDPSRPTVASSNQDGEINFITDAIVWDHHFGWREGYPSDVGEWLTQLHANWKNLRSGVSYSAGASIYHQEDSLRRPVYNSNWHPERWQTHFHEEYYKYLSPDTLLWGIFVGNMFDYGAAGQRWGEGNGLNDSGLVTFDRKYRKDSYYFYKANWNSDEPFIYIAERRWDRRRSRRQTIKVYSNRAEVELFVNGVSHGWKSGQNGTILWSGVELAEGENLVEVRSSDLYDSTTIKVLNSQTRIYLY